MKLRAREGVLEEIARFWGEHGYSPSFREIVTMTELNSTSAVAWHLGRLQSYGLITYEPRLTRTIVITEAGRELLEKAAV